MSFDPSQMNLTLEFVEMRQRGLVSEEFIDETIARERAIFDRAQADLVQTLTTRNSEAKNKLKELIEEAEAIDPLEPSANEAANLNQTIQELSQVRLQLKATVDRESAQVRVQQELLAGMRLSLSELNVRLERKRHMATFPYETGLLEFSNAVNACISGKKE